MEEEDVAAALKTLSDKIDKLSRAFLEGRGRMDVLSSALVEQKYRAEEKIKEKPIACMGAAFFGGLTLGYLMSRKS